MSSTSAKKCYCHTCQKPFHYLGIARHRTMHKEKREDCKITYTHGDTYLYLYSELEKKIEQKSNKNQTTRKE